MKAAVIHALGEPPRYDHFTDPTPNDDEVLVDVRAAGLHPIVRALARGAHYASTSTLPLVAGIDGVGRLADGSRVYFGFCRPPFGTMAERGVARRGRYVPIPDGVSDGVVAALLNPGMSAWLSLLLRGRLRAGENVVVLGATGVAGQLAVQLAKRLGAGRVVACGRNPELLARLTALGADALLDLSQPKAELAAAFAREAASHEIHVVVDYVWGEPAEALIAGISRRGLDHAAPPVRLVQAGQSARSTIELPAAPLRSSALEILGVGLGTVAIEDIMLEVPKLLAEHRAKPLEIAVDERPLAQVEAAFTSEGEPGRRIVLVP